MLASYSSGSRRRKAGGGGGSAALRPSRTSAPEQLHHARWAHTPHSEAGTSRHLQVLCHRSGEHQSVQHVQVVDKSYPVWTAAPALPQRPQKGVGE